VAVGAVASGASLQGQGANRVSGFDHVAVPMQNCHSDESLLVQRLFSTVALV